MKTLCILNIIYTVISWLIYHKQCKKENISLDPFKRDPTFLSFTMVMSTMFCFLILLVLSIFYLP